MADTSPDPHGSSATRSASAPFAVPDQSPPEATWNQMARATYGTAAANRTAQRSQMLRG